MRAEAQRIRRYAGTLDLTSEPAQAQSPRRRSRRRVALRGGVAVALIAAGGSAAAWASATRPTDPYSGFCAQTVTLDRAEWSLRGFAMAEAPDGTRALPDALEICSQMWRTGMITRESQTSPPTSRYGT